MEKKKRKISTSFQLWLTLIVAVAFIGTSIFLWFYQTDTYKKDTENVLLGEITDVIKDISDTSENDLLVVVLAVATETNSLPELCRLLFLYKFFLARISSRKKQHRNFVWNSQSSYISRNSGEKLFTFAGKYGIMNQA